MMTEWIRVKNEMHGRAWLHDNYEQFCLDTNSTSSSESYMRMIRKVLHPAGSPTEPCSVSTVEDSMDFHDVDMTQFSISKVKVNTWGSKDNQNKQVKLELTPRVPEIDMAELIADFQNEVKQYSPSHKVRTRKQNGDSLMLEINIPDVHFGLLSWAKETGATDYDIHIAREVYLETLQNLLTFGESYKVSQITIVAGSDFFNSDSLDNTTTKGTKQTEDSRFQKSFQAGWHTLRDAVDMCAEVADVELIIIPGNHDFQKSFYLGEVLSAWYDKSKHVTVDNEPRYFKYKKWGCNLLGYSHGDTVKPQDLPLLMATDVPEMWASTSSREWHIGHGHQDGVFEKPGCKVVKIASIAPASDWIAKMGYRSMREAQAFLYCAEKGRIANFNYRPVV